MTCAAEFKAISSVNGFSFSAARMRLLVLLECPPDCGWRRDLRSGCIGWSALDAHLGNPQIFFSFRFFLIVLLNWDLDDGGAALTSIPSQ